MDKSLMTSLRGAILVSIVVVLIGFPRPASSATVAPTTPCPYDDATDHVIRCISKGQRLLKRYLSSLEQHTGFDTCREFSSFLTCFDEIQPCLDHSTFEVESTWNTVVDNLAVHCSYESPEDSGVECFETEFRGLLARRCDDQYHPDVRQQTTNTCLLIREHILCKHSLVSSGCGVHAGRFAFDALLLVNQQNLLDYDCDKDEGPTKYNGFRYSPECPQTFPRQIKQCEKTHMKNRNWLQFHEDNDLITTGKGRDVREACRQYRDYKQCIRPLMSGCRKGVQKVLDYDGRLRTYTMKMDYICKDAKTDYIRYSTCYRSVLANQSLERSCNGAWSVLEPKLKSLSSYEFYCNPDSIKTRDIRSVLNVLRVCYEDVFSEHCGPDAGSAIGGLMSDVFDDPLYLRFQSKPDCQAHNHEYHQQMADIPPRSVPRIRPYSKSGRSSSTTGRRSSDIVNIHVQMDDQSTSVNLDSGQHPDYVESSDLKLGASMEHNSAASGATLVISINFYVVLSVLLSTVCALFTTTFSRTVPHR